MVSLDSKSIYYELRYLFRRFPLHRFLLLFFTILGALVVSLSDAQSFFTSENSPIPKSWTALKHPNNARLIAIAVIAFPGIFIWFSQGYSNSKEIEELLQIVQAFSLPFLEKDLNRLHESFTDQFNLSNSCRIYILQPIRRSLLDWHLHIVCYCGSMENRELSIRLDLDEGPIGYAFQSIRRESKYKGKFISLSTAGSIPAGYRHFKQNNKDRIKADIQGCLVIPSFDNDFLNALIVVDTADPNDLIHLQDENLKNQIVDWIGDDPKFFSLLWRLKTDATWQQK